MGADSEQGKRKFRLDPWDTWSRLCREKKINLADPDHINERQWATFWEVMVAHGELGFRAGVESAKTQINGEFPMKWTEADNPVGASVAREDMGKLSRPDILYRIGFNDALEKCMASLSIQGRKQEK